MVLQLRFGVLFVGLGALLIWGGCSVVEETTGEKINPKEFVTEAPPIGVFRPSLPQAPDTVETSNRSIQLSSKQDTLTASVVQYSRSVPSTAPMSEETFVTAFTIQIGAFADASNALTLLKKTKERVGEMPVLNRFEPRDRLYRVSIGLFETREGAIAYQQTLIKTYGVEFKNSWVSQISK